MKSSQFKLRPPYRLAIYSTLTLLWVSGFVWWALMMMRATEVDLNSSSRKMQGWMLKAHGAAAMLTLVAIGTLIPIHIVRAWKAGRNRTSGAFLVLVLALLTVTGYGLYYYPSSEGRGGMEWVHEAFGLPLPLILLGHVIWGRRGDRL